MALVCGSTQGLGRVVARLFATEGAWIAVNFRADIEGAKSLVDEIRSDGGRALLVPGDVRTYEGAWTVARYVEQEWAQVDVLLHAASLLGPDEAVSDPAPLISELAPGMRERHWGRVVIFKEATSIGGSDLYSQLSGQGLLINTLKLPAGSRPAYVDEVGVGPRACPARCALFFGSAWNTGISGAELSVHAADS